MKKAEGSRGNFFTGRARVKLGVKVYEYVYLSCRIFQLIAPPALNPGYAPDKCSSVEQHEKVLNQEKSVLPPSAFQKGKENEPPPPKAHLDLLLVIFRVSPLLFQ